MDNKEWKIEILPGALDELDPQEQAEILKVLQEKMESGEFFIESRAVDFIPADKKCPYCRIDLVPDKEPWDDELICPNEKCETFGLVGYIDANSKTGQRLIESQDMLPE